MMLRCDTMQFAARNVEMTEVENSPISATLPAILCPMSYLNAPSTQNIHSSPMGF